MDHIRPFPRPRHHSPIARHPRQGGGLHPRIVPPASSPKVPLPTPRTTSSPAIPHSPPIQAVQSLLSVPSPIAINDIISRRGEEPRNWPWNPMPDGEHEFRIVFARPFENDRENPRLPSPRGTVRNFAMLICAVGIFVWLARNESIAGGVHYSTWLLGAMTVFTTFLVCTTFRLQWHTTTQIQAIQRSGTGRPKFILAHGGHSALPAFLQSRARLRSFDPEQAKLCKSPNDDSALILDFDHQQARYLPSRWNMGYTINLKDSAKLRKVAYPSTEAVVSLDRLEWLFGRARDASERRHYRTLGFWYLPKRS